MKPAYACTYVRMIVVWMYAIKSTWLKHTKKLIKLLPYIRTFGDIYMTTASLCLYFVQFFQHVDLLCRKNSEVVKIALHLSQFQMEEKSFHGQDERLIQRDGKNSIMCTWMACNYYDVGDDLWRFISRLIKISFIVQFSKTRILNSQPFFSLVQYRFKFLILNFAYQLRK